MSNNTFFTKRASAFILSFSLIAMLTLALALSMTDQAYAASDKANWYFVDKDGNKINEVTITWSNEEQSAEVYIEGDFEPGDATPGNSAICTAELEGSYLYISRHGVGDTWIMVRDKNHPGQGLPINVHCPAAQWNLDKTEVTLKSDSTYESLDVQGEMSVEEIISIESSDPSVVTAETFSNLCIELRRQKYSDKPVTITVTASDGSTRTCIVHCPLAPFTMLKHSVTFNKSHPESGEVIYMDDSNRDTLIKTVTSSNTKVAEIWFVGDNYVNFYVIGAGKSVLTLTDSIGRTEKINVTVEKDYFLKNTMVVKASKKSLKAKDLAKKAKTVSPIKVSKVKGKYYYQIKSASAKAKKALKLDAGSGKIKVKKGTKKGTYTMKVTVKADGEGRYRSVSKTVTVTIKVK